MHVEMHFLQLDGSGLVHARLGDQSIAQELLLAAQKDILRHRQRGQDRLFLEHHGDAGVEGVARRGELDRLAVDQQLAAIGLVDAVQHLEQRGLARAVLADDADDLVVG